jgi:glutamate-1-semialdehyde 2,1-aminomutase
MPVGAFGGRAAIMDHLAPDGAVYQAGTLSGNPVAMAAGLATLAIVLGDGFFDVLTERTRALVDGLVEAARSAGVALSANAVGGMFGIFFTDVDPVTRFSQVTACDIPCFNAFHRGMLEEGVYLAPSAYEAGFVSAAHGEAEIEQTVAAAKRVFERIAG